MFIASSDLTMQTLGKRFFLNNQKKISNNQASPKETIYQLRKIDRFPSVYMCICTFNIPICKDLVFSGHLKILFYKSNKGMMELVKLWRWNKKGLVNDGMLVQPLCSIAIRKANFNIKNRVKKILAVISMKSWFPDDCSDGVCLCWGGGWGETHKSQYSLIISPNW